MIQNPPPPPLKSTHSLCELRVIKCPPPPLPHYSALSILRISLFSNDCFNVIKLDFYLLSFIFILNIFNIDIKYLRLIYTIITTFLKQKCADNFYSPVASILFLSYGLIWHLISVEYVTAQNV